MYGCNACMVSNMLTSTADNVPLILSVILFNCIALA